MLPERARSFTRLGVSCRNLAASSAPTKYSGESAAMLCLLVPTPITRVQYRAIHNVSRLSPAPFGDSTGRPAVPFAFGLGLMTGFCLVIALNTEFRKKISLFFKKCPPGSMSADEDTVRLTGNKRFRRTPKREPGKLLELMIKTNGDQVSPFQSS